MSRAFSKFLQITALTVILSASFAQAQLEAPRGMRLSDELKHARSALEVSERTGKAFDTLAREMRVSRDVVFQYFKRISLESSPARLQAWDALLKSTQVESRRAQIPASEFDNASVNQKLIADYLRLKNSHAGKNLRFSDFDLAQSVAPISERGWSFHQREKFGEVVSLAADIAERTNAPTEEAAFDAALKKLGLWDKFNEGCK